ncbi:uncharacterized protein LOC144637819 [Oculina patagonica]
MGDSNLEEVISLQRMLADLSESEKQQAKEDLAVLQGKTKNVVFKVHVTAKSLRKAAKKLDEVWKDCKIAHAFGTTAGIVGGVLTIGGGIATIMTLGAAAPLLLVGMGVGAAGAGTNLGTSIVEAAINSNEIKKAEADLKETLECINEVNTTIKLWLDRKEESRLLYIFCLAMQTLELSEPVIKLLQQVILNITSIPAIIVEAATRVFLDVGKAGVKAGGKAGARAAGKAGAKAAGKAGAKAAGKAGAKAAGKAESGAKAGAKAGSKLAGGLIIGVSAAFLVWDAIDLGFTIRDLVQDKGSEAASALREKADELEKQF